MTGLCELKNLHELDLSYNMLDGTLPQCLNNLSSLKLLDISSNRFTGILVPSLIANLTSMEYLDFSHNKYKGSFFFSSFSNHTNLEFVRFISDNDRFEVETEEPIAWIPMFQLKFLSYLIIPKGLVIPRFLLHRHKLQQVDMSHNSMEGHFPNWLIKNNTNLERIILRNNLFSGMSLHRNTNMKWLDMSGNRIIGNIPDHIPKFFPNLHILYFSMNSLSGVIPSSVVIRSAKWIVHKHLLVICVKTIREQKHPIDSQGRSPTTFVDISNNNLSGRIPEFFGELSTLRILILRKNKFSGSIPKGLCLLRNVSLLDLSYNSLSGFLGYAIRSSYHYHDEGIKWWHDSDNLGDETSGTQEQVEFTTKKKIFLRYKGDILNYMAGLDLSCNKLIGEIPEELGLLTQLRALNLSHNQLIGPIPVNFSNLAKIESLDLSSNGLTGTVPTELIELTSLSVFNVSHNNLSGKLPEITTRKIVSNDTHCVSSKGSDDTHLYVIEAPLRSYRVILPGLLISHLKAREFSHLKAYVHTVTQRSERTHKRKKRYMGKRPKMIENMLVQVRTIIKFENGGTNLDRYKSHNVVEPAHMLTIPDELRPQQKPQSCCGRTLATEDKNPPRSSRGTLAIGDWRIGSVDYRSRDARTFTKASYEGNPFLCGQPLEKKSLTANSPVKTNQSAQEDNEKWYDIDMTCFYASSCKTCALLFVTPQIFAIFKNFKMFYKRGPKGHYKHITSKGSTPLASSTKCPKLNYLKYMTSSTLDNKV
ncbi:hypothetical protein LXL04_032037 [Taraxacum kok-saghyz]